VGSYDDSGRTTNIGYASITASLTGIAVGGVFGGARFSEETRPRNMMVEWIIRVY